MPPTPIITASVNQLAFVRLMNELALTTYPTVKFTKRAEGLTMGHFDARSNVITLFLTMSEYATDQLRFVSGELSRTLLHECRHAWQLQEKGIDWLIEDAKLPYDLREQEKDAGEFEGRRLHDYRGLVRVLRSFPSSPFSRLAKTEARVLRNV